MIKMRMMKDYLVMMKNYLL